jgi:hypothetical protein
LYFVLSATSLGAVIVASYKLFFLIKWLGPLIWFISGLRSFLWRKSSILALPEATPGSRSGTRIP